MKIIGLSFKVFLKMSWWILVNSSRTVKLADFGMTRAMFESDYYRFSRKGQFSTKNLLERVYDKCAHALHMKIS
jgi:hypothetical protein